MSLRETDPDSRASAFVAAYRGPRRAFLARWGGASYANTLLTVSTHGLARHLKPGRMKQYAAANALRWFSLGQQVEATRQASRA